MTKRILLKSINLLCFFLRIKRHATRNFANYRINQFAHYTQTRKLLQHTHTFTPSQNTHRNMTTTRAVIINGPEIMHHHIMTTNNITDRTKPPSNMHLIRLCRYRTCIYLHCFDYSFFLKFGFDHHHFSFSILKAFCSPVQFLARPQKFVSHHCEQGIGIDKLKTLTTMSR